MSVLAIAAPDCGYAPGTGRPPAGEIISLTRGVELPGVVSAFQRDEEIFAQESEVTHVYKVVSGTVRVTRLLSDGRRHIASFHFPGDVFGLEIGDVHHFTAEAVTPCRIASVKRSLFDAHGDLGGMALRDLWRLVGEELERMQEHSLLLGRMSAVERVCTFLHDMAKRRGTRGVIDLPMSRLDIADYLGLTIETVSRTLTQLRQQGVIGIEGTRHIVLRQGGALGRMAA